MNKNVKRCALVAGAFAMASMGNVYQVQASGLHASEVLQQAKRQIKGKVVDAAGETVIGANVLEKGTTNGVITDIDGNFVLNVSSGATLEISYIGYVTQTIKVTNQTSLHIVLKEDSETLDEVVVVGYGTMKKSDLSGASVSVGEDAIKGSVITNLDQSLQGRAAGVSAVSTSGAPGSSSSIRVRGQATINSNAEPLYVIDGIPIESSTMGIRSREGASVSPLATLNSADIVSITVLKDATATSIYGARAANGVIVITTKQGVRGKLKVNLTAKFGLEMMPNSTTTVSASRYRLLNQEQYENLMVDGLLAAYPDDYENKDAALADLYDTFGLKPGEGANTDWMDEVTRVGKIQDYNLDISSGGVSENAAKYFLSFNYFKNEAIIIGKDLERFSGRFNLEQEPGKVVKYGLNSSFSYSIMNMGSGGGYYSDPITLAYGKMNPLIAVRNKLGEWNFENTQYNPVAQRSKDGDRSEAKTYRAILSPYVTIRFSPAWSFTSRGGLDLYSIKEFGYWSFLQPQGKGLRGMGEQGTTTRTLLSITNTLSWVKAFDDHHVNMMVGQEAQHTRENSSYLAGSNYPVEYLSQIELAAKPSSASTSLDNVALASFFFNGQYDYANKYYLSASVRTDGSSRFGSNNRWATFYSVGARYRLTGESFMQLASNWLDELTLRVSYGTSGNQDVGGSWYASRGLYGFGYNYNSQPGSYRQQAGNPDLKWEQTAKFNVGVDLALWERRVNVEFDYYRHLTKDMVFNVPLSLTSGMSSIPTNVGELENKGFEFSVGVTPVRTDKVDWTLTFVGSANKNEIKKLSTDLPIESSITIVEPGRDIYTWKMKEWAGVDPDTGSPMWWIVNRDKNGKEISREKTTNYNKATKEYVGKASPKFQGGLTSSLNLYGFDFSFQLNYSLGSKIFGDNLRYDEQTGAAGVQNTTRYVYENRWQKPGDEALVPRFVFGDKSGANSASTRFLMKGDYLKIRNITLGYTLPKDLVQRIHLNNVRIYVSSDNLHTFVAKDFRGFDPSGIAPNGVQWWNYPTPRNVMFGLNIGF